MTLSRRDMLKIGFGAAASLAGAKALLAAPEPAAAPATRRPGKPVLIDDVDLPRKLSVGLELWSVRQQCEKELPVVLKAVAKMGYQAVELAHSYYNHSPEQWRKLLDENHLRSCGMHMSLAALEGDAFKKTVEIHKVIGTPYLIVASLPHEAVASLAAIKKTGERFNAIADRLAEHNMKVGYHCHGGDFAKVDGTTPWEAIAESTKPEVIMQIDTGNCMGGGGDPMALIAKYPGRSVSVHLKEHGGKPGAVLGEGDIKWMELLRLCLKVGGTKQFVIEEEGQEGPAALATVERALKNLRKLK